MKIGAKFLFWTFLGLSLSLSASGFSNEQDQDLRLIIPSDDKVVREIGKANVDFLNPNSIKVLVWNIFKGKKELWERDFDQMKTDKDVLALQEMLLNSEMEAKLAEDPYFQFITAISFIYDQAGFPATGVSTASMARANQVVWLRSPDREPLLRTPKMSLITVYNLYNSLEKLMVANVHGINFVRATTLERQLSKVFEKIKEHKGPVILAGDFNTWTKGKLRILKEKARRHLLREVEFPNGEKRKKFFGNILDHVFTRDLKTLSSQVLEAEQSSDHNALEAEFSW